MLQLAGRGFCSKMTSLIIAATLAIVVQAQTEPAARWGQATAVVGSTLLVHGGKIDKDNSYSYTSAPNTNQLLLLDLSTSFDLASPPWVVVDAPNGPALAFHSLTAYSEHELVYFGGDPGPEHALVTRNDSAGLLQIDGTTGTWTLEQEGWASQPMRRQNHIAVFYKNRIYITGGEKADGSDYGFAVQSVFNPETPLFADLTSTNGPPDLVGHAAVILSDGRLIIFGGLCRSAAALHPLSNIYIFSISDGTWSRIVAIGKIPIPRRNFAVVRLADDTILIHGGTDQTMQEGISDGFILNPSTGTWTELPALSKDLGARWDHIAVAVGNSVFFAFGYATTGPAPPTLQYYDSQSDTFSNSYQTSASSPLPNTNSLPNGNNGQNPNPGNSTNPNDPNHGHTNPPTNGNPHNPDQDPGHDPAGGGGPTKASAPVILGSVFGALALLVIIALVITWRRKRSHRRGWSGMSDDGEKVTMVGGFQQQRGGVFNRLLNLAPGRGYIQPPPRERFDILADEDTPEWRQRPRQMRQGTSGSASSYGAHAARWVSRAPSVIGSVVNASVTSMRSAIGRTPSQSNPFADPHPIGSGGAPLILRRTTSYSSYHDPFGDNNHVADDEYEQAMLMQHEVLRRSSAGVETYGNIGRTAGDARLNDSTPVFIPLATVASVSTDPTSHSHGSEEHSGIPTSTASHSVRTPEEMSPRMSPVGVYRSTSAGSRIGASLIRTMSALSSMFSHENQGYRGPPAYYDHPDFRDPNPPPPRLGLQAIKEQVTEDASRESSRILVSKGLHDEELGRPAAGVHAKSMSSLQTTNSDALERMGGDFSVAQRIGSQSSRQTLDSIGGDETIIGAGTIESPATLYAQSPTEMAWKIEQKGGFEVLKPSLAPLALGEKTAGDVGEVKEVSPTSPRRAGVYGLVPKPTLYVANPGGRGATASD